MKNRLMLLLLLILPIMWGCLGTNRYVGYPCRKVPPTETEAAIISSSTVSLPFLFDDYDDVF
jgi:hypothetical protein